MKRGRQKPKAKKVAYELIPDQFGTLGRAMYDMVRELIREYRDDLRAARIALAWCISWRPDADGRLTLGKCKKASDLDRELMAYDFVILLNRSFWNDPEVTNQQRLALLDHEIMHAAIKCSEDGEPEEDERGRIVYRTRKHDLEEFTDTVKRHGIYRYDIETFYAALRTVALAGYKPCAICREEGTPGWVSIIREGETTTRLQRCVCWQTHLARIDPDVPPPTPAKAQALPIHSSTPPSTH